MANQEHKVLKIHSFNSISLILCLKGKKTTKTWKCKNKKSFWILASLFLTLNRRYTLMESVNSDVENGTEDDTEIDNKKVQTDDVLFILRDC